MKKRVEIDDLLISPADSIYGEIVNYINNNGADFQSKSKLEAQKFVDTRNSSGEELAGHDYLVCVSSTHVSKIGSQINYQGCEGMAYVIKIESTYKIIIMP